MISVDGWFDFARREPGPADKVYSQRNTARCAIPHDAVGYKHGWYSRLFSTERLPNGRYTEYAATSQHGIILDEIDPTTGDAVFIQHYSIFSSCWGSGSREINTQAVCWEQERIRGNFTALWMPPHMIRTNIRLFSDLANFMRWPELRRPTSAFDKAAQAYRHRECIRFGAEPTACDSGRTPLEAIIAAVNAEEDDMAITMAATGDSPTGYRVYALGEGPPRWIVDGKAADELIAVFGQPKPLTWAALRALGAA